MAVYKLHEILRKLVNNFDKNQIIIDARLQLYSDCMQLRCAHNENGVYKSQMQGLFRN